MCQPQRAWEAILASSRLRPWRALTIHRVWSSAGCCPSLLLGRKVSG